MRRDDANALLCPFCGNPAESIIVETRQSPAKHAIRRRRECQGCGKRFTTYESVDVDAPQPVDHITPALTVLERAVSDLKRRLV